MPISGDLGAALIAGLAVLLCALTWLVHEANGREFARRMEVYLRAERKSGENRGQRSTVQIMKALDMTSGQVIGAARRSRAIKRLAVIGSIASAETAVFECAPAY